MCDVLLRVEAGGLDCWPDPVLQGVLGAVEGLRARVDSVQALVLAELVRRGRVPEAMFATMVSLRDAQRRTKAAVALGDGSLPGAAAALAAGEISFEHVAALAGAKDHLPDGAVPRLLAEAKQMTPDKFARALRRASIPTAEVADASTGQTAQGGRWFRFSFDGLDGTIVLNGLEAVMDRQWRAAHPERAEDKRDRPPYGQRLAAALLDLAHRALTGTERQHGRRRDLRRPKAPARALPAVIVVITYDKLFRDAEAAGICTTIDGVPLPVATVRKLLVDAKIYPIVLGGDGEILDYGRSRRFFSTTQKMAAAVRDLSCQFADCDKPIRYADYHHCIAWAHGGPTNIANAAPTCAACHDKLTNHGYHLQRSNGTTNTYAPNGQLIHQRTNQWKE